MARMKGIRLVAVLAALSCVVIVAVAHAGVSGSIPSHSLGSSHRLNYRSVSYSPFSTGSIDLYANCTSSQAVLGGGVHVSGPPARSRVGYGYPQDGDDPGMKPDDYWVGAATNLGTADRTITTYGVCRKAGPAGVSYVSNTVDNVAVGDTAAINVSCPNGSSLAGGGSDLYVGEVKVSAPFDSSDHNQRPDDGWRVVARNENEYGSPENIGAHAICLPSRSADLSYRSESAAVAANGAKTVAAHCRGDSAVTAGGWVLKGSPVAHFVHSTKPLDSATDPHSTPDDGWSVTAVNLSDSPGKAKVDAICLG